MALRLLNQIAVGAIIGKLSFDAGETLARTVLERMLDASASRGRDARGVFAAPGIGLGWCAAAHELVRRSAGEGERTLGVTEDRRIRAIADSRLTNAGELRDELERAGHRFRHHADEDIIAHAYERWGTQCFARFCGPFACAVWDEPNRRLVIARDHVGVRPLYYALLHGHGIVFASHIRALFHDPGVPREWCPSGIDAYLALGYVPAPLTTYRRVSKLEPAHALIVEGRSFHIERFWDLPIASNRTTAKNAASALGDMLKASVHRELKDAKKPGLLYSGGLASCALLAATPPNAGVAITVDLDHDPSELTRSDATAARLGHIRELETIARPVSTLIDEVTSTSGEPVGDPSALSQFAICQAAAQRVGVALSSHGAAALWSRDVGQRRLWDDRQRRAIYTRGFAWQVRDANPFACHLNARTILANRTIPVAEHAAAAAGIELRMPFLDRPIVELAIATGRRRSAFAYLRGAFRRPNVLRQLIEPHVPARLMPPVHAAPPSQPWLGAALQVLVPRMLFGPRFDGRGIVSRPALQTLWNEHLASRADHARRLWALVMLEFWFRESIDGDAAAEPLEYAVLLKAA